MMRFTYIMWDTILDIWNRYVEIFTTLFNGYDKIIDIIDVRIKKILNIK